MTLFTKNKSKCILTTQIYVDDIIFRSSDEIVLRVSKDYEKLVSNEYDQWMKMIDYAQL